MEIICLGLQSSPFLQDLSSNCDDTIAQNDSKIQAEQHILAKLDVQIIPIRKNIFFMQLRRQFISAKRDMSFCTRQQ
jgi:hypothetical protein